MIFQFPDLETLRLAITSAQVPPDVSAAPAEVAFDAAGRPSVRPVAGIPPKPMLTALRKLGVKQTKDHYTEATLTVECWPQVLPVQKAPAVPEVTSNTPVLFDLPARQLPTLVTEMLRLGNDRQSFRTVAGIDGDRVLLKVIGPPYYTLLRAIDKSGQKVVVTAFIEKAPRVWVELGYDHPMATLIRPAEGQVLLLRPEREWTAVEDGPFQDVYDVLDFKLPAASVEWQESQLKGKLSVPLKLVPGNAADVAELWVLTEEAVDQLDALVRDADERLMARLSFAVARENGQTTIVLKTRPSKLSPPVLPLAKAHAFKPYWKLPNLFLPVGKRLMPTLRRDAVRKLLANDPDQVVWLMPQADGKFTPEVLPDNAFRPLEDWIDYIIDHEHEKLAAWVQATRFDFDSFICRDEQPDKPKPPSEKAKKNKKDRDGEADEENELPPPVPKSGRKKASALTDEADLLAPIEMAPPSELKVRQRELEDRFKAVEGPLDAPERIVLWPQLAQLAAALKDRSEAAICWTNAFWELPAVPTDGSWGWLRTEDPEARKVPTADEWDAALSAKMPSPEAARGFAARVVHCCRLKPIPESFVHRLPKVREYLERHENVLGVRAVWLAWWHLAGSGGPGEDVKSIAHVRDRLLHRLLGEGLNKERDLPYFLRMAGEQNSERMRLVRDRAMRVHRLVEAWHAGEDVKVNKPYVDLMFAFGLAKLGEVTSARDLMDQAKDRLLEPIGPKGGPDPAHEFLWKAFAYRIENALQGKPHSGPLPSQMMARLETIDEGRNNQASKRYVVDRLRQQSWILEPQEKTDPYAMWKRHGNDLQKTLADLPNIKEPARLEEAIKKLVRDNRAPDARLLVFAEAVPLGPRIGEEFTVALIQQSPAVLDAANKATGAPDHLAMLWDKKKDLLERSLFLAAHFDRAELVQVLFNQFLAVVQARTGPEMYDAINRVARECLRSLRKLGLKDEINRFLTQMTDLVVQGRSLAQLRNSAGNNWPDVLGALVHLAEGYLFFGGYDKAKPFLDEAGTTLLDNMKAPKERALKPDKVTHLARTYVTALGQGPVDEALNRIEALFRGGLEKLPNGYTTATHFSRFHLNIVEDVVRSLMSDNMALGDQARRWLDDDEYLVRRRIHGDMRKLLASHGM